MEKEPEWERLDIEEQAREVGYLTPIEYAKIRDMSPQLVYYHIRQKHIELEWCKCGRRVLRVQQADEALKKASRSRRREVDARSDQERAGDDLV